ncbi:MAG: hypothetical protein GY913_11370 [Proteobacteria bacterium]|nr:hypothetical protein [Pseudomonadota bacterium]MCP4917514.1 hypothetical protein [Pseudomonadota bacterium]
MRTRRRAGQSTVEYLLYISVIAVALTATAYVFIGPLEDGFRNMDAETRDVFKNGMQEGDGDMR